MFFRYHGNFSIKLSHVPSYITTYKNSKTNRAQKKACFLSTLRISKHPSVARCWLSVDFYLSCHKHTPKLLIALSRVSKSLLDRFLDRKTWFFVFSDFYARCGAKGLIQAQKKRISGGKFWYRKKLQIEWWAYYSMQTISCISIEGCLHF